MGWPELADAKGGLLLSLYARVVWESRNLAPGSEEEGWSTEELICNGRGNLGGAGRELVTQKW